MEYRAFNVLGKELMDLEEILKFHISLEMILTRACLELLHGIFRQIFNKVTTPRYLRSIL